MRHAQPAPFLITSILLAAPLHGSELRIFLSDENHRAVAGRLEVHGSDGKMYQADGSLLSRRPGRTDAGSPYLSSFVIQNSGIVKVPPGRYRVIAERGLEYKRVTRDVTVEEGKSARVQIQLSPWIRMRERGWWSGDMHVHRPMEEMPLLLEAEDLNLGIVFTMWNRQNLWQDTTLPSDWIRKTGEHRWMTVTNAEDERGGGAWMLHGLRTALGLESVVPAGKPVTESWDPPGIEFVRKARSERVDLFPWFDLEKPIWWEAPVMMALERPDSIGLLNNHYDQYGMYNNEAWARKRDVTRFSGLHGFSDYSLHLIYRFWNLGWMVTPSAGAASGVLPNPVGYNRMYVKIDGEFSVEKWYRAVKAGRVLLSNGPILFFEPRIDHGRLLGRIEAISRNELDRVEIVANGKVIKSWKTSGRQFRAALDENVEQHSWVAARCYERNDMTVRLAHTAPIKLPGRWNAREDAGYYREWIEELQRNPKTPAGTKAGELYRQAIAVYRELEK